MFTQRCPHCGIKLGNFLYADVCYHCQEVLERNLPLRAPMHANGARAPTWLVRTFFRVRDFVES